jgi:hypothetical protein
VSHGYDVDRDGLDHGASPWFNHIDLTHVIMGIGFTLVWSGVARGRVGSWT